MHQNPMAMAGPGPMSENSKSISDYIMAIRRRFWLLVSITFAGFLLLAIVVIRMPDKYQAVGELQIEPPDFDGHVQDMMAVSIDQNGQENDKFVANKAFLIRSRGLAMKVGMFEEARLDGTDQDVADEIAEGLSVRPIPGTNVFVLTLKGSNPARVTMLLDKLMTTFMQQVSQEVEDRIKNSREHVSSALANQQRELDEYQRLIEQLLLESKILSPDGESMLERQYENLRAALLQKQSKLDAMEHQLHAFRLRPEDDNNSDDDRILTSIDELKTKKDIYLEQAGRIERTVRMHRRDPAYVDLIGRIDSLDEKIKKSEAQLGELPKVNLLGREPLNLVDALQQEIATGEAQLAELAERIQKSLPLVLAFRTKEEERKRKIAALESLRNQLSKFEILTRTRSEPIKITALPVQPMKPVWPPRKLLLAVSFLGSLAGSLGLVLLLEHADKTIRSPEQIAESLRLSLFGVVPRIRRHPKLQRAGHLWTSAVPHSLEADSYRNIRASILGYSLQHQSTIRKILVTSAKAGEGKSTTALNLAATFARAGERTILVDADLRRPSLGGLVGSNPDQPGLVEVLCGQKVWQEVVVSAEVAYLDLMTTGVVGDTPIEILGSRELRQLLAGLAKHYDRVILDGPAVLGLADCRVLGQIVDGCLMVVRANPHSIHPIMRARAMLEQSRVPLMGVVYNGLTEDYRNWSSYGAPAAQMAQGLPMPGRMASGWADLPANPDAGQFAATHSPHSLSLQGYQSFAERPL
jgi:capsular exopolysaccharide synthesis family protein